MTNSSKLHQLPKVKLEIGKTFIELSTYKDVSLWWLINFLYFTFTRSTVKSLIMSIYKRKLLFLDITYMLYLIIASLLSKIFVNFYKIFSYKKNTKKFKVIVVAQNIQWKTIRDIFSGELKKGDAFWDSTITILKKKQYNIITTYMLGFKPLDIATVFDKWIRQRDIVHKPIEYYLSLKIWKEIWKARKHFSSVWGIIQKDKRFTKIVRDAGIEFSLFKNWLRFQFNFGFVVGVAYIEMARRMIKEEKPDLILMLNEYGFFERAVLIASKLEGVPVLAVQHGVIHPSHDGYMYTKDEISPRGEVKSPYCPIPDKTAVYGPYYKELLTKVSAYPENSVVVTGQPRYDILYYAHQIYDRREFCKKYGVDPNRKIILWTTQTHGLPYEENIKNLDAIFSTMEKLKNAVLVIKQHPGEGTEHTKLIKKYIEKYKVNAILTSKKADTFELLYVCDLMITRHSTTAMEAVALNKPVIILNLSGEPDPVDYMKEGVAVGVYRKEDLGPAIRKLLEDDTDLAENRERYVRRYLYKIDGKATQRVVNLIEKMIKEKWENER